MTRFPVRIATVACATALALGAYHLDARAQAVDTALASFSLDVDSAGNAEATVIVDPSVLVAEVDIFTNDPGAFFGPVTQVSPGIWMARGTVDPSQDCSEATAHVLLGGKKDNDNLCLESLTVEYLPTGETFVFDGDFKTNTGFTASNGDEGSFHTSCSQCLRVGQRDGDFEIVDLVAGGKLIEKCDREDGIDTDKSSKKKNKSKKLQKALEKEPLLLELSTRSCKTCFIPG